MSISVNREGNPDGSIDLSINIATTQFFNEFWEKAIKETGVKIFKENNCFIKEQLNDVLSELSLIREWAEKNLTGRQLMYMRDRIDNLLQELPNAFDSDDTVLYIY